MSERKRHNFKKLKIWQIAMEQAKDIFKVTIDFLCSRKFGIVSQMNRCTFSVLSNRAEGSTRTNIFFYRFLDNFLGSSFELQTHILLATSQNYSSNDFLQHVKNKIEE